RELAGGLAYRARVALLRAAIGAARGRHQEAEVVRFEAKLEEALEVELGLDFPGDRGRELRRERLAAGLRLLFARGAFEVNEERVGVAIEHAETAFLEERTGALDDRVAATRYGRWQPAVEKAAPGRPEHAIERVHEDLDRARERLVLLGHRGRARVV